MAFILDVLTAGAKAAFPMLQSLAETPLSANEILRQVAAAGFGVQRQAGLDVIGALRNNIDAARYIRLASPETILNPQYYGVALTNTLSNFTYTVRAIGVSGVTGERVVQDVNVRSRTAISQNDAMAVADSYLGESDKYQNIEGYELTVTNAIRNANYAVV